jgi:hypothetical protein
MRIHSRAIICFDMVRRCGSVGQASRRLNVSTNSLRGRPAVHQQSGSAVECKGGDHLDIVQVRSMNWYVKGIDDKLPAQ